MKVTGFVGSPRKTGNTARLVEAVLKGAEEKGADTAVFHINSMNIMGCQSCYGCRKEGKCVVNDDMQQLYNEVLESDLIVIGSPVYMWQLTAQAKAFLDRLYALFSMESESQIQGKKLVLAFSQGNENADIFKNYYNHTIEMLKFVGFDVIDLLVAAGNRAPDDIEKNTDIMERAKNIGGNAVS